MWVKDIKTGEVADLPVEAIKAWPGGFVAAAAPKAKQSDRAASSVSASSEAATKEKKHG